MRETTIVQPMPASFRRPRPDLNIAIRSDVILGSPSAKCNGVGICRVMGIGEFPDCPCPRISAVMSLTPTGNLQITFERKGITADQLETHFKWGYFQVVEPYRLSIRFCRALGWKKAWVYPGAYKVWETASTVTVIFDNHNQNGLS